MYKIKGGFLQLDETLVVNRAERSKQYDGAVFTKRSSAQGKELQANNLNVIHGLSE
jgi:hypothetical protein